MPIYEYECLKCKKGQEIIQKFSDDPVATCPDCGGEMKKLISTNSFVLKGTGWYMTDYGSKKDKDKEKTKSKSDSTSDTKKDSPKKEKKVEPAGTS
jgi:putative FmdB family regulatory protein